MSCVKNETLAVFNLIINNCAWTRIMKHDKLTKYYKVYGVFRFDSTILKNDKIPNNTQLNSTLGCDACAILDFVSVFI